MSADLEGIRSSLEKTKGMVRGRNTYARIAGAVFEEIKALRAENITLLAILDVLKTDGHLPDDSNIKALSKALKREEVRRWKRGNGKSDRNERSGAITKAVPKAVDKTPSPDMTDEEKAEKARLKKLGLHPVDIGNGVRKLPGGGFSF
ncbi:hypothetical protein FACS1894167_05920 [Synergistales bacterium]|nr:hypothetical protein FACS1894167_05920 [Synergistales bacterium]